MLNKKLADLEELWDFICSHIGFDEEGLLTQDSIKRYIKIRETTLKLKKSSGHWKNMMDYMNIRDKAREENKVCVYEICNEDFSNDITYDTEYENKLNVFNGTLQENNYKFCPFCGGKIKYDE